MTTEVVTDKMTLPTMPGFRDLAVMFTPVKSDGIYHYLINKTVYIKGADNPSPNFKTYIAKEGDTWTLISYKLYNTIEYWWILCKINQIADPTQTIQNGASIKYLSESIINGLLTSMRNS